MFTLKSILLEPTPSVLTAYSLSALKCDVITAFAPTFLISFVIATASALPSAGSVPAPSSSRSKSVSGVISFINDTMFLRCPENVDKDCSMDCSSPISVKMLENVEISLSAPAGINMPESAMTSRIPTSLSVTVLPPAFGPVISITSKSFPRYIVMGFTLFLSIRGCLPATIFI